MPTAKPNWPEAIEAFRRRERPASPAAGHPAATTGMGVDEGMTALSVGSGDVEVLASPILITLVEQTAVRAIRPHFPPELTTVGTSVELKHEAATVQRGHIEVEVWLEPGTDRRLRFGFKAYDGMGTVGHGTHERVIVERRRFLEAAEGRRAAAHARQRRGLPEP